ncbi:MAG: Smr/MutS family protein, partial [Gemmatimonadota bacterium]
LWRATGRRSFGAGRRTPSYRFIKGVPGRSYGLAIARRLGVDGAVVARAEERVPHQEMALDALLREAEARNRHLLEWEQALSDRAAALVLSEGSLAARAALAGDREAELRRREKDAERRARAIAQEYLLNARARVEEAIQVATEADAARDARRVVEEAVRDLRAAEAEADAAGAERVSVVPGDRVRLRSGGLGTVVEQREDGRLLVVAGSLRLVVAPDQVAEVLPPVAPVRSLAAESAAVTARADDAEQEVDLRGMRVDEAEMAMLAALDAAVLAAYPLLKVIHGKGTGAVRERVHELVRSDCRVTRFGLAPHNQGGSGVTIVELGG